jgi:hypothetical protein
MPSEADATGDGDPAAALDAAGDAFRATRSLLVPIDRGRWLRLAVIAAFVGGTVPGLGTEVTFQGGTLPTPSVPSVPVSGIPTGGWPGVGPPTAAVLVGAAVVGAVVTAAAAVAFVGATMAFVLVDGLTAAEGRVRVRGPFRRRLGAGLRLLGFRVSLLVVVAAVVGLPVAALTASGVQFGLGVGVVALAVPYLLAVVAVGAVAFVVSRLTTDLVVPTMVAADCGVIEGWRRLRAALRGQVLTLVVYLVARIVMGSVAGMIVGVAAAVALAVVAFPFLVVFGPLAAGVQFVGSPLAAAVVVGIGALLFVPTAALAVGLVQAPVVVFFRYYSLFVLGLFDADLDMVTELRDPTTSEGGDGTGSGAGTGADEGGGGWTFDHPDRDEGADGSDPEWR